MRADRARLEKALRVIRPVSSHILTRRTHDPRLSDLHRGTQEQRQIGWSDSTIISFDEDIREIVLRCQI